MDAIPRCARVGDLCVIRFGMDVVVMGTRDGVKGSVVLTRQSFPSVGKASLGMDTLCSTIRADVSGYKRSYGAGR